MKIILKFSPVNRILQGNCLTILKKLKDESVDCCVTSPPYWGLRDYGTGTWEGGDSNCDHKKNPPAFSERALAKSTIGAAASTGHAQEGYKEFCGKCGARRIDAQIGLEKTPEEYVTHLVNVFKEIKRVLKKEGTCWLNLGDSYNQNWRGNIKRGMSDIQSSVAGNQNVMKNKWNKEANIKPKNLVGIPWRVAFALQADGWILRQDIIWAKPNAMPESVTDRCGKAHEYIFLLTKSTKYYFDHKAIKEPVAQNRWGGKKIGNLENSKGDYRGLNRDRDMMPELRNKRSVWIVPTRPFKGAHFATFPETLIEPCIKAGCPKGGESCLTRFLVQEQLEL